jgi:uncharacterized membrane protein
MIFETARIVHIIAGFVALFIFWVPIVTKKGGTTHIRVGWMYIMAMSLVAISALIMGLWRIYVDPTADNDRRAFSLFLIYIAILSSASAWFGIRVLRNKKRTSVHRNKLDLFFSMLLFGGGIVISIYGFSIHSPLITWFPFVGIFLGFNQLRYWLTPPQTKMSWFFEHITSMMGCCIATITAFTVFGAPRLLHVSSENPLLWFFPTIVMVPIIVGFVWHYKQKFSKGTSDVRK